MTSCSELRLKRTGHPAVARDFRRALTAFLTALGLGEDSRDDVATAVGEALANAVEHAYCGVELGAVELQAHVVDGGRTLSVEVIDCGSFIERAPRPDRGFGLRIAQSIVRSLSIDAENGTHVRMLFDISQSDVALLSRA